MNTPATSAGAKTAIRVAEYVRMSTDQQTYSPANQSAAISAFAAARGMRIVRRYFDGGRSGIGVARRDALQRLLADVSGGEADYEAVLVYDVSRWGRFQDADEAAYYEFICTRAGIPVIYVAEAFTDDRSPFSSVMKGLKRVMAAEFSRELSVKVAAGHRRLVGEGFRQGGTPGYAFRRMLVDHNGSPKQTLAPGERKSLGTDRIVLVLGPEEEQQVVRRIFREFLAGRNEVAIANRLNQEGVSNVKGERWKGVNVHSILTNEKYRGDMIYGRTRGRINGRVIHAPAEEWTTVKGAYPALVSRRTFAAAQQRIRLRGPHTTDEELLNSLRAILAKRGRLTIAIIQSEPGAWSIPVYIRRFGSLRKTYQLLGYDATRSLKYADARRRVVEARAKCIEALGELLRARGIEAIAKGRKLVLNPALSIAVVALRAYPYKGRDRWFIRQRLQYAELVVFARMDSDGETIHDYVLWPHAVYQWAPKEVATNAHRWIAKYALGSLSEVSGAIAGRASDLDNDGEDKPGEGFRNLQRCCWSHIEAVSRAVPALGLFPGPIHASFTRELSVRLCGQRSVLARGAQPIWDFVVIRTILIRLLMQADLVGWLAQHKGEELRIFQSAVDLVGMEQPSTLDSLASGQQWLSAVRGRTQVRG